MSLYKSGKFLHIRVTAEVLAQFKRYAEKRSTTVSQIVRDLILKKLKEK